MADDLTLWGVGTSRTMRAHWMLLELGLEYQCHPIRSRTGETLSAEFIRLNPRHKIPVLRHNEFVLSESGAIVQYLAETFAHPRVYAPDSPESRARLNEWCYFVISELDAGSLYVVRRHEGLKEIYGAAPDAVASAKEYFRHNIEAMAPRVAEANPYLFGERVSAADILLVTCLDWAVSSRVALSETLSRYLRRVIRRPAYQAALKRNFPD